MPISTDEYQVLFDSILSTLKEQEPDTPQEEIEKKARDIFDRAKENIKKKNKEKPKAKSGFTEGVVILFDPEGKVAKDVTFAGLQAMTLYVKHDNKDDVIDYGEMADLCKDMKSVLSEGLEAGAFEEIYGNTPIDMLSHVYMGQLKLRGISRRGGKQPMEVIVLNKDWECPGADS